MNVSDKGNVITEAQGLDWWGTLERHVTVPHTLLTSRALLCSECAENNRLDAWDDQVKYQIWFKVREVKRKDRHSIVFEENTMLGFENKI